MTLSLRGVVYFVGFLLAMALALNAQEGQIAPWFGVGGIAAIILVDWVLTFWRVIVGRSRRPNQGSRRDPRLTGAARG